MTEPVFENERSKKIYDKIVNSGRHADVLTRIRRDVLQLHGDNNTLPSSETLTVEGVAALEIYSLASLEALGATLEGAISRAHGISDSRRIDYVRQIKDLIRGARTKTNTDSSRILAHEFPLDFVSDYFSSFLLRFRVVGGSLIIAHAFLRPSEHLRDLFFDISHRQINTSVKLRWSSFFRGKPLHSIRQGNEVKSDLIAKVDNQIRVDAARAIRAILGAGICLEYFGGVPVLQYFMYDKPNLHNSSLGTDTFFTLLYQAGVGINTSEYYSRPGDSLIEQRCETSHGIQALCKTVLTSKKYLGEIETILEIFAAKEILRLQLLRLSLIEREYISLLASGKLKSLTRKRFELYALKTVHGIMMATIEKRRLQPDLVMSSQTLDDFSLNGIHPTQRGYFTNSKQKIKSLRLQIDKNLKEILDNSETVRDESNARFQASVGFWGIALAAVSILTSLFLAPMLQIRVERWTTDCFDNDETVGASKSSPSLLCASLEFMR